MNPEPWQTRALCAIERVPLSVFFPRREDDNGVAARAVCARCEVRVECLEETMVVERHVHPKQREGIFGGLTGRQRFALQRQRLRARRVGRVRSVA